MIETSGMVVIVFQQLESQTYFSLLKSVHVLSVCFLSLVYPVLNSECRFCTDAHTDTTHAHRGPIFVGFV